MVIVFLLRVRRICDIGKPSSHQVSDRFLRHFMIFRLHVDAVVAESAKKERFASVLVMDGKNIRCDRMSVEEAREKKREEKKRNGKKRKDKLPLCRRNIIFKYFSNPLEIPTIREIKKQFPNFHFLTFFFIRNFCI